MLRRRSIVAVAAVLLVVVAVHAWAQDAPGRLEIRSATLDPADGLVTVTGIGFGENPVVALDGQSVDLLPGGSDTQIFLIAPVVVLSAPGNYRLTVVDRARSVGDGFVLSVPAMLAGVVEASGASAGATNAPGGVAAAPATSVSPTTTQVPDGVDPTAIEDPSLPRRTALGNYALAANTTGVSNTAVGYTAMAANTSGSYNTGLGAAALYLSTTGGQNVAVGAAAMGYNVDGNYNSALGFWALGNNASGERNSAVGEHALLHTTGSYNTAVGSGAGETATSGAYNVFLGANASGSASDTNTMRLGVPYDGAAGQNRTFIAGIRGTSVTNAMPVVIDANGQLGTADHSTTFGIGTSTPVTTLDVQAAANVHLGVRTGQADATAVELNAYNDGGAANIPMEFKATRFDFTPGNVGIGTTAPGSRLDVRGEIGSGDGTLKNVVSYARYLDNPVGVFGTLSGHDLQVWANGSPQMAVTAAGNVGIGTVSPQYKLHVFGSIYATGSYLGSDRRLKRDVQDLRYGLREVLRLRPVSFGWKDPALGATTTTGLIAQEAEPIVPELVARAQDPEGMLSLNYVGLVPVLIKAVQEQQATLAAQEKALAAQELTNRYLLARMAELERQLAAASKHP